jgi:hypothetical protein
MGGQSPQGCRGASQSETERMQTGAVFNSVTHKIFTHFKKGRVGASFVLSVAARLAVAFVHIELGAVELDSKLFSFGLRLPIVVLRFEAESRDLPNPSAPPVELPKKEASFSERHLY